MNKSCLRAQMKEERMLLSEHEVREKSGIICKRLTKTVLYKNARSIAIYLPIKNEVDPRPLAAKAFSDKKRVFVPVTDIEADSIFLSEIFEDSSYKTGAFGIKEPAVKRRALTPPELIIVPGLAFDFAGGRVGWGKGFYDRLCADVKSVLVGVAYEFQLVGAVASEPHDRKMDYILTESELVVCG